MTVSAVEICNRALNAVGQAAITALDEGTPRADVCNRLYAQLLDELLQDHPWNFAIRRTNLAANATDPEYEWDHAYDFPADCVRVLSVGEEYQKILWTAENRQILTDEDAPIYVRYLSNDVEPTSFPPKFVSALALRIAVDLAIPMTDSASGRERLVKEYNIALRAARGSDARENGPRRYTDETLIDARR